MDFDQISLPRFPGYPQSVRMPLMRPEGQGTSRVWLIGEALGEHESRDRLPFRPYAEAGSVLERAIRRAGFTREQFVLSNCVWYRPPDNQLSGTPWELEAISICQPFQDEVFARFRPRAILALGAVAMRELTGLSGPKRGIEKTRGFIVGSHRYGIPVVGTYHPSYLRRGAKEKSKETGAKTEAAGGAKGMALLGVLIRDLQLAVSLAQAEGKWTRPDQSRYVLGGTLSDWERTLARAKRDPALVISYDFETRDSLVADDESEVEHVEREVTQVQVSLGIGEALVSPWTPELLPLLRGLLQLPNPKLDWNGRGFDRPLLRGMGVRTDLGPWIDGMSLWHHSQPDLPRGLQFAASFYAPELGPWKHLSGADDLLYGAYDVDAPQRIYSGLRVGLASQREPHSERSLWDGYESTVRKVETVLDGMTARGIPVNAEEAKKLDLELEAKEAELLATIQAAVPEDLCQIQPKTGYKRHPKLIPQDADGRFVGPDGTVYLERVVSEDGELRWGRRISFNPNSSEQIKAYIRWQRERELARGVAPSRCKWKVPVKFRTTDETTGFKELIKLAKATGDQVLFGVREVRNVRKFRSTYIAGWAPAADGRVHPFFGTKPATGQLSSTNPNAQNFPKHSDLSIRMRGIVLAEPGRVLIELDYKSFHVLTLGFEARDPSYMRMARLDMHSFFAAAGLLQLERPEKLLELSDPELMAKLKAWRADPSPRYPGPKGKLLSFGEVRDEQAKRTILGYGFGMGPARLYHENEEVIASKVHAAQLIQSLDRLFPITAGFRQEIRKIADRQSYLVSRFGCIRRFYSVFERRPVSDDYEPRPGERLFAGPDGRLWLLSPGDDSEAAIAFLPANDAFGVIKHAMVRLSEAGLSERYGLVNQIHDALIFHCPERLAEECLEVVGGEMQSPSGVLVDPEVAPEGLSCEVEAMLGRSWDKMSKVKLPPSGGRLKEAA